MSKLLLRQIDAYRLRTLDNESERPLCGAAAQFENASAFDLTKHASSDSGIRQTPHASGFSGSAAPCAA